MSQNLPVNQPLRLLAISGSLRSASSNTTVLHALQAIAPANVTLTLYDGLGDLPYFNPDLDGETDTPPPSVGQLRAQIGQADGLLISSPEYAHGVPGVLKNALDWLVSSLEFPGKPVALINISPRSTFVQASLSEILITMSASLVTDATFTIGLARKGLDMAGMLADPQIAQDLRAALDAFVQAILSQRAKDANGSNSAVCAPNRTAYRLHDIKHTS
jgi:chromate reductase, NAD(P)H dehydrogenase (quinone)